MKVKIEALRPKYGPPRCFRCQGFFHSSRFCTRAPRCVKCAGAHLEKECTKPIDQKPKCCLCESEHPASFLGCPRNPRNKVDKETENPKKTSRMLPSPPRQSATPHHHPKNRSNLTVICWNANGIRSRIEEFRSFIADWNPDIVNLQDTHLQPCHNFIFSDYNIYRNDRTFRGGGTAIMIKRSIPHHQIVLNNNSFETTAIKLTRQDDQPITIVSAYRPSRKPLVEQDLHRIFRSQSYVLVAGDLNAKHVCILESAHATERPRNNHPKIL
ncbi:RNA-directed DNA polymerase from mobile element jockey [Trichonephila clavipes]|nr:RNA-directed DNA polymerase from mobile element jockey [Trichonephila clavipes]